jgi:hypothetical protein
MRVNLSKIYRDTGQAQKAVRLFRDYVGKYSREAWHEWAVAERWNQELLNSIVCAAISLCDLPGEMPSARTSAGMSANTIAQNLSDLFNKYGDRSYLAAIVAVAKIAMMCSAAQEDDHGRTLARETLATAALAGAPDVGDSDLVSTLQTTIAAVLQLVDFETIAKGRVARTSVASFMGLSSLVRRQIASLTTQASVPAAVVSS